jgi:peptide/nickel transport system ATP-binding protein
MSATLLELRGLTVTVGGRRLLDGVDLTLARGRCLALVGESGSGKTTLARAIVGLQPVSAGHLLLDGAPLRHDRQLRRRVQLVFQDPYASLNPLHDVLHHLARPLLLHGHATPATVVSQAHELLVSVGLTADLLDRRPDSLSGGQRQRVALARALAVRPDLLIADEPTSMLDTSLRTSVLALLTRLQRARGLALLLITHDLASARLVADELAVLHAGRLVERGPAAELLRAPAHPYTDALVRCASSGERPLDPPTDPTPPGPEGCSFAARCPRRAPACSAGPIPLQGGDRRAVRCLHPLP